jgi:hypothetical protein
LLEQKMRVGIQFEDGVFGHGVGGDGVAVAVAVAEVPGGSVSSASKGIFRVVTVIAVL